MGSYSTDECNLITSMWLEGYSAEDICAAIKSQLDIERSVGALRVQAGRMGLPPRHKSSRIKNQDGEDLGPKYAAPKIDTKQAKPRRCLRCRSEFLSAHAGNRICDTCKQSDDYDDVFYSGDSSSLQGLRLSDGSEQRVTSLKSY